MGFYLLYLLVYIIINAGLNLLLYSIFPNGISWLKFPKKKIYKGKKTPIYKLSKGTHYLEKEWMIEKWELKYSFMNNGWLALFLPFIPLFTQYRYCFIDSMYVLKSKGDDFDGTENLEEMYNSLYNIKIEKAKKKKLEREAKLAPINKLNKEFNENFIK